MPAAKVVIRAEDSPSAPVSTYSDKRPPTPFHRHKSLPVDEDEETDLAQEVILHQRSDPATSGPPPSDSGVSITLSQPAGGTANQHGQTIFLDEKQEARKSLTKGGYLESPVSTPLASSTGDEYSYPDPFVAKAALQTLRSLTPGHRSVDGGQGEAEATARRPVEAVASRRSSVGSLVTPAEGGGYATDTSEREKQRQVDNAMVIPTSASGSTRKRSKPLHRDFPATKLTSALRRTDGNGANEGRFPTSESGYYQAGREEISGQPSSNALHRKPLPPQPPRRLDNSARPFVAAPDQYLTRQGLPTAIPPETRSRGFSFFGLRQSLPAVNFIQSSRNRDSAQHRHDTAAHLNPQLVRHSSDAFQVPSTSFGQERQPFRQAPPAELPQHELWHVQPEHTPVSASIPILESLLPSTGGARRIQNDSQLLHPAENLSLYLKLASLPKWEKWIDPDAETTSRWYNRPNWGTGRARTDRKSRQRSIGPSSSKDMYTIIEASTEDGASVSGRKRTIDRLVQSVMQHAEPTGPTTALPKHVPGSSPPLSSDERESGDQPGRYLRSWEARRRFLDAVQNCECGLFPFDRSILSDAGANAGTSHPDRRG